MISTLWDPQAASHLTCMGAHKQPSMTYVDLIPIAATAAIEVSCVFTPWLSVVGTSETMGYDKVASYGQ